MNKRRHDKNHFGRRTVSLVLVLVTLVALCMPSSMALSDEGDEVRSEQVVTVPEVQADAAEEQAVEPVAEEAAASAEPETQPAEEAAQPDASSSEDESTAEPEPQPTENVGEDEEKTQPAEDENKADTVDENDNDETAAEASFEAGYYIYSGSFDVEAYADKATNSDTHYAEIYFLADPIGDPISNSTSNWQPSAEKSTLFAPINVKDAEWVKASGNAYRNIVKNVAKHITSWPDGSTGDTWVVKRGDSTSGTYFTQILDMIWNAYKTTIAKQVGVSENELVKEDVLEITLRPRKISENPCNNTNVPGYKKPYGEYYVGYHIDCSIDVKSTKAFAAKFWVQEPGETEYRTYIDGRNYRTGQSVEKTDKIEIGSTKVVNGITYVLDGWYVEDSTGNAPGAKVENWNYTPSTAELEDGTVNFYAHYTAQPVDVTVTKQVVGPDKGDTFTFNYTAGNTEGTFTLKNGESETIQVPYGTDFTVTEETFTSDTYTYTTTNTNGEGNTATLRNVTTNRNITFTNTYEQYTGSLALTKTIENQNALTDDELAKLKENLSFTISGDAGEDTVTGTQGTWTDNTFTYTWDNLPAGSTWTVTESNQNVDYVTVETTYNQQTATIPANDEATLSITNTYTPIMGELTINKTVTGSNSKPGSFTFTAVSERTGITYTATIVTKADGTATISGIPAGKYTVTELENDNYTCTNGSVKTAIVNPSDAVSFTNNGTGDSFQDSSSVVNVGKKNGYHVKFTVKGKPEEKNTDSGDNTSEN